MKHEKQITKKPSKVKRVIFSIVLAAALVCATVFIINLPQKIQNDYIKSLPENSMYPISVGNKIEADSMSEINKYLQSFERINSQSSTVTVSDEMKKEILKKSQTALRSLPLEFNGAVSAYLDTLIDASKKLSAYNESSLDSGEIEIYTDIMTTDCYDKDNNLSSVFFYQVNIMASYPRWEQYNFYFSPDLENIFSFSYSDGSNPDDIYSDFSGEFVWYEYSGDGSYINVNSYFGSYLTKTNSEYDGGYFPDIS